jgi:hypothetical protein
MRMIRNFSVGSAVSLALATALPAFAAPEPGPYHEVALEVDIGLFQDELAPYGDWVEVEDYGRAWVPHVHHGWRPYTEGHWEWTEEYGWLWVSDEAFGWAVFHYGRWYPSPRYGWVWVPRYEWAPAWVAFRMGDGYAGWAPLPPAVDWEVGVGFRVGAVELDRRVDPRAYCFVPERAFLDPVRSHVLPVERNTALVRATRDVTSYAASGDRVVNRSIPVQHVREVTHRPVPRARVVDVGSAAAARRSRVGPNEVPVFRPSARVPKDRIAARERARPEPRPDKEGNERRAEARRETQSQRELGKQQERNRREAQKALARDHERQVEERRQLERRQQRERADLERQHQREVKHPPRDVVIEDLRRRQEEQHRALEERQGRERQAAQQRRETARQEKERQPAGQRREARAEKDKNKQKPHEKPGERRNGAGD